MTINKSLISIAAATLLAAGFAGCGSSSSSSSTPTASTTTTTGIQSSVNAVDGYIYNATVKAWYLDDDNVTLKQVTLVAAKSIKDTSANPATWTVGSKDYALDDANTSIKDKIKFFELLGAGSTTVGSTFTAPSYIESDGIAGYNDTNDTLLAPAFRLFAPANSKNISPLSSLVYQKVAAQLGAPGAGTANGTKGTVVTDLNDTFMASIESNATALATQLGLSGTDILNTDPLAAGGTYQLVNALYKEANAPTASVFTAIMAGTKATDLESTMALIKATAKDAKAIILATSLEASAADGSFTEADIATMNVDQSVTKGAVQNASVIDTKSNIIVGDMNVSTTVKSGDLLKNGDKINKNSITSIITFSGATDTNISNQKLTLLISAEGAFSNVENLSDNNSSSSFMISVPFELNSTQNAVGMTVNAGDTVKYEMKASDGSSIKTGELNVTTAAFTAFATDTTANSVTFDVGQMLKDVSDVADGNLTSATYSLDLTKLSKMQVVLVDSGNALVRKNSNGQVINFAKSTFASMAGTINGTGIRLINLDKADLRGGTTGANSAPTLAANLVIDNNASVLDKSTGLQYAGANISYGDVIVVNEKQGTAIRKLTATATDESSETNSSITISGLPSWVTVTKATLVASSSNGSVDFNTSIDTNATVSGHGQTLATIKITDEFGKTLTANDSNISFMMNHAPVVTADLSYDVNITGQTAIDLNSTSAKAAVTDDEAADMNVTFSNSAAVAITKYYDYTNALIGAVADVNWSSTSDSNMTSVAGNLLTTGTISWDVNASTVPASDGNFTVTYTVTDIYGATSNEKNATINIKH